MSRFHQTCPATSRRTIDNERDLSSRPTLRPLQTLRRGRPCDSPSPFQNPACLPPFSCCGVRRLRRRILMARRGNPQAPDGFRAPRQPGCAAVRVACCRSATTPSGRTGIPRVGVGGTRSRAVRRQQPRRERAGFHGRAGPACLLSRHRPDRPARRSGLALRQRRLQRSADVARTPRGNVRNRSFESGGTIRRPPL